ncbi:hypothetical protein KGF54_002391 [Candida jiufengensis]|uniref:uncharacterized protein n=1 Tax=Candida jiufengensis TaxID=497108 RepID=UPI002225A597|nr:uncharacterized protein KGF54_002391 [Candida jiufengensis]KAI5954615.1 hypothetical protein KGF54_002391 [Candida jiufengensis]
MDQPYMETNNLETHQQHQQQHQINSDSSNSQHQQHTTQDHDPNNQLTQQNSQNNNDENLQPHSLEQQNFQPQQQQHTQQLPSYQLNFYGDNNNSNRLQLPIQPQQHINYQSQSQYMQSLPQNQPPILQHPHLPLQNSNYISNSYQQLPITQSPYGFQHQLPSQSQSQQFTTTSTKSRKSFDSRFDESNTNNLLSYNNNERNLVAPIPPLHVQQQLVTKQHDNSSYYNHQSPIQSTNQLSDTHSYQSQPQNAYNQTRNNSNESSTTTSANQHHHSQQLQPVAGQQMIRSTCTRCKKEFDQPIIIPKANDNSGSQKSLAEPKIFKLCHHCRDLQRQRSRRWQKKTKNKQGVCRRCGSDIPFDERKFVLCPSCRQNLRTRKANRAAQGKCVHCSGPLDTSILHKDENGNIITESNGSPTLESQNHPDDDPTNSPKSDKKSNRNLNYKVCQRCRENDKIRRINLEKMGNCNRCAKALDPTDYGKHKVCLNCRSRKKKPSIKQEDMGGQHQQSQELNYNDNQQGQVPDYNPNMVHSYQQQQPYASYPYNSNQTSMITPSVSNQTTYNQPQMVPPQLPPHQPYTTSSQYVNLQAQQHQPPPQQQQQQQQPSQTYYQVPPPSQEFYKH